MAKKKTDWWPDGRQEQLNLVKKWLSVFTEPAPEETGKKKWQIWSIPEETFRGLSILYAETLSAFEALLLSGARGGPLGAAAAKKFLDLEKMARDVRRRYFFSPPISPEDMVILECKKNTSRTRQEKPARSVNVTLSYPALHSLMLELVPGAGDQDVSGFTFNIRLGIIFPDGKFPERSTNAPLYISKVPLIPEDLPGQFSRSRKHETFTFSALEAGATVYFAVSYINSHGETGPWVMVKAIIT